MTAWNQISLLQCHLGDCCMPLLLLAYAYREWVCVCVRGVCVCVYVGCLWSQWWPLTTWLWFLWRLEQSVNVLWDTTPGLQPHNFCLCNHFTAVCVKKPAITVTLQTVLFDFCCITFPFQWPRKRCHCGFNLSCFVRLIYWFSLFFCILIFYFCFWFVLVCYLTAI